MGLKETLDMAIERHMQRILLAIEGQQQNMLASFALGKENPPQVQSSRATPNESTSNLINRSHTLPIGKSSGDLVSVKSSSTVRNQPRRLTAGCIDKLVMDDAIRSAGYFDRTSSTARTAWEEVETMSKTTDDTQSSKSIVIPGGLLDSECLSVMASTPTVGVNESEGGPIQDESLAHTKTASSCSCAMHSSIQDSRARSLYGLGSLTGMVGDIRKEPRNIQCLHLLYALWGITSWSPNRRARWYKAGVRFASVCATGFFIADLIQQPNRLYELFAETAFSVSSLISLAFLGDLECIIGQSCGFLGQYAKEHKFLLYGAGKAFATCC